MAALAACIGIAPAQTRGSDKPLQALRNRLDQALSVPDQPKSVLGAKVIDLHDGRVLYERKPGVPLIPASNMKLIVMAAVIDQLGTDHRYKTLLAIREGDLIVIGDGDPTFGDERLSGDRGEPITAVFHRWAARLKDAGVRQIPGDVVVDDSIFDRHFVHDNWPANQYQAWYEAPIGGLNFDSNCVSVVVSPNGPTRPATISMVPGNTYMQIENKTGRGSNRKAVVHRKRDSDTLVVSGTAKSKATLGDVTIRDPGLYFGSVLKTVLAAKQIKVHGKVVRTRVRLPDGGVPDDCHVIAIHQSPIADALERAGKNSLGMAAEGLIKTLGARRSGTGTWPDGIKAVEAFLGRVGVSRGQFKIDDGSGLSRENRLSADATVRVLAHMFRTGGNAFELFRDSLAVAGVDGTLRNRMKTRDVKGRVFGKTGFINGVRTPAGYVHTESDHWLAFAFFYNQARATIPMRQAQDRACRTLVSWSGFDSAK